MFVFVSLLWFKTFFSTTLLQCLFSLSSSSSNSNFTFEVKLNQSFLTNLNRKICFRPLLLTDFLMESYNVGGSVSLLALNGVFSLIQVSLQSEFLYLHCNFNCPHFLLLHFQD